MKQTEVVIFSDLDGTLIDHDTYSYSAAQECLSLLRRKHIPLILASSKTAAEMILLRDEMGFAGFPAICENGAGLIEGGAASRATREVYARLRDLLDGAPTKLRRHFRGFGDMTVQEIADATGLPPAAAADAQQRNFSEPGIWTGSDAQKGRFLDWLRNKGVSATSGGRFLTLSFGATKADRMSEIMARYGQAVSIALGDAPNDAEMIEAADYGVIVSNPAHAALPLLQGEEQGRIIRTKETGPAGWCLAVMRILSNLGVFQTRLF